MYLVCVNVVLVLVSLVSFIPHAASTGPMLLKSGQVPARRNQMHLHARAVLLGQLGPENRVIAFDVACFACVFCTSRRKQYWRGAWFGTGKAGTVLNGECILYQGGWNAQTVDQLLDVLFLSSYQPSHDKYWEIMMGLSYTVAFTAGPLYFILCKFELIGKIPLEDKVR